MDKSLIKDRINELWSNGTRYRDIANTINREFNTTWYDGERVRGIVRKIRKQTSNKTVETKHMEFGVPVFPTSNNTTTNAESVLVLENPNEKNLSLKIDKLKLRDEISYNNEILRKIARIESFNDLIAESISKIPKLKTPMPILSDDNYLLDSSGVLMIADQHFGTEFTIKGLVEGEILNHYSPEVFKKNMWKLLEKTVCICDKEGFRNISIMDLGDSLDGILRISQLMSLKYGIIDSCIEYSEFMSNWLNELSNYLKIDYYSTEGNHTMLRLLTGKKGDFPNENMQKIIDKFISVRLEGNPNVNIIKNNTDKIFTNIRGFNILGIHGEEKSASTALKDYSTIYNKDINYLVHGHKHHPKSEEVGFMKGTIGVGSIMGINDFAMKIKATSNPSATFCIFTKGEGKTIEYNIGLGGVVWI